MEYEMASVEGVKALETKELDKIDINGYFSFNF